MKLITLVLFVALFVAIHARHYTDKFETEKNIEDDQSQSEGSARDYRAGQLRHRRKRWQSSYGYNYSPPSIPHQYLFERRDYERENEVMPQIWRLLDEISAYVKRPPPPPQPIYVPYPVPYPVPQSCKCTRRSNTNVTSESRFPILEDDNQNWGIVSSDETDYEDDGSDGSRPISLVPITPSRPVQKPQPAVEHGSEQEGTVKEERTGTATTGTPTCNAAILSCCNEATKQLQKACFTRIGCAMTFAKGNGCTKQSVSAAIDSLRRMYSPRT